MFRERGKVVLLGLAQVAGLMASVALMRALGDRLHTDSGYLLGVLALAPAPLLALANSRLPAWLLLAVSGLMTPLVLLLPLTGTEGVLVLGLGTGLFQALVLAEIVVACRSARLSVPRTLGLLGALSAALILLVPEPPVLALALASLAGAVVATIHTPARSEPLTVRGFWRARAFLLGTLGYALLLALAIGPSGSRDLTALGWGACAGCLLAAGQRNPWRGPGLVPFSTLGLILTLLLEWLLGVESSLVAALLGLCGGLGMVPLATAYLGALAPGWRAAGGLFGAGLIGLMLTALGGWTPGTGVVLLLTLVFLFGAGYWLLSQFFEQMLEMIGAFLSRVRLVGPGAEQIPVEGPLVLVANHTAYLDPLWISVMIPRKLTPMMTSVFYDVPGIRWLMVHAARAIRVPAATYRREAPELQEAIAVLQAGGCLLIFPEARLRKTEEKLLYPFGQGLWHILRAVPETQVMPLWVEGAWGSWTSQANGQPPFCGKPIDLLRKIEIAIAEAAAVDPRYLEDREGFRHWLMSQVLACRGHLNLPVPTVEQALGQTPDATGTDTTEESHQIDAKDREKP